MIIITEQAQQKIKKSLTERQKGKGIRIGVKTTGCSGLSYVLEYIDETTSAVSYTHLTLPTKA